jgi:uncharacterized membrane protein
MGGQRGLRRRCPRQDDAEATFAEGAYCLIGIGIVGALVAAIFGMIDLAGIARGTKAFKTGLIHMTINVTVVVLFLIDFLVRTGRDYEDATVGGFVLSLIGLALLGISGYLGGQLAYSYGLRVADEDPPGANVGAAIARTRRHRMRGELRSKYGSRVGSA